MGSYGTIFDNTLTIVIDLPLHTQLFPCDHFNAWNVFMSVDEIMTVHPSNLNFTIELNPEGEMLN